MSKKEEAENPVKSRHYVLNKLIMNRKLIAGVITAVVVVASVGCKKEKGNSVKLIKTVLLIISLLFSQSLPAQEAIVGSSKSKTGYPKIIHSVAVEFNNAFYFKGRMTEHPYPNLGYETQITYGTEWLLKYNLTFKSGFGISLEAVKGSGGYEFKDRVDGFNRFKELSTPITYVIDMVSSCNKLGCNIKASYRHDINQWLSILPEIGLQMQYYESHSSTIISSVLDEETGTEYDHQYLYYDNSTTFQRKFFPDLSAAFNVLFHKKDDPRHNFTAGLNMNLSPGIRYFGYYSVTPPFRTADNLFYLTSSYIGLRFGYSYSSFSKPLHKTKEYRKKEPYTVFDLQNPVHALGLAVSFGGSLSPKFKNTKGIMQVFSGSEFVPELTLKYSCAIKNGWGISAEIPFGFFARDASSMLPSLEIPADTVWSNGVVGFGYPNGMRISSVYLGFALKASHLANVHKNISLQSELGAKWLPFLIPAKHMNFDGSAAGKFLITDGTETDELIYMNCLPVISAKSYVVPDLAFSFSVLVHGKNPANNFIFGINGNISFLDRFHFKYQTTDVLPARLQSSGEFGWRMSSIGFHIGYQWLTGKKKTGN